MTTCYTKSVKCQLSTPRIHSQALKNHTMPSSSRLFCVFGTQKKVFLPTNLLIVFWFQRKWTCMGFLSCISIEDLTLLLIRCVLALLFLRFCSWKQGKQFLVFLFLFSMQFLKIKGIITALVHVLFAFSIAVHEFFFFSIKYWSVSTVNHLSTFCNILLK